MKNLVTWLTSDLMINFMAKETTRQTKGRLMKPKRVAPGYRGTIDRDRRGLF